MPLIALYGSGGRRAGRRRVSGNEYIHGYAHHLYMNAGVVQYL